MFISPGELMTKTIDQLLQSEEYISTIFLDHKLHICNFSEVKEYTQLQENPCQGKTPRGSKIGN